MNEVNRDIKSGQLKNVYLICGEEEYLKRQKLSMLIDAFGVDKTDMNFAVFDGESPNEAEIADLMLTVPFLSEKRVIIIKNSGFAAASNDRIAASIDTLPDTSFVVFVEKSVKKNTKVYKAIAKRGTVEECVYPSEDVLCTWIVGRAKKNGKKMTSGAWNAFLKACMGTKDTQSMEYMDNEWEKLLSYCWDKEDITEADVIAIASPQYQDHIFDMINAIGKKDQPKVMRLYEELLESKVPPMQILSLIIRQFEHLLVLDDMMERGMRPAECAREMGVQEFVVNRYLKSGMLKKFPAPKTTELLNDAIDTQQKIRSGRMKEEIGIELLMIKYSKKA